jgi:hypothetical protein
MDGAGCSNSSARHLGDHYAPPARCDPSETAPKVPVVDGQLARTPRRPIRRFYVKGECLKEFAKIDLTVIVKYVKIVI